MISSPDGCFGSTLQKKKKDALDLAFMFHGSTSGCTSMGWVYTPIMPRYGMYMAGTLYGIWIQRGCGCYTNNE